MKKIVLVLGLSLLCAVIVLRSLNQKKEVLRFIEEEQANKNFGAFPPDIPEEEFQGLFV